jgi:predicted nucleic acid-binding protein
MKQAWRIQDATKFGWWNCMLLGSVLLAGAKYLVGEDLQHERQPDGMIIFNPFRLDPPQLF